MTKKTQNEENISNILVGLLIFAGAITIFLICYSQIKSDTNKHNEKYSSQKIEKKVKKQGIF